MKNVLYLLLFLFFLAGCQKEDANYLSAEGLSEQPAVAKDRGPKPKVNVCHRSGEDKWHVISINENALRAHLAHGDVLLEDKDGDGWVEAANECVPGGDCNDEDPKINPGVVEDCTNGKDDNCDGLIDDDCCPYFTVDEIVALGSNYRAFFSFRDDDCFPQESIVFFGMPCNFGVSYDVAVYGATFIKDLDCNEYFDVDIVVVEACEKVMLRAQEILEADDFCDPFTSRTPDQTSSVNLIETSQHQR